MEKGFLKEKFLTIPQVKKLLEAIGEENLDQFQRRTLDYASKFSKIDAENAEKLVEKLTKDFELEEAEAVQIVNCMPSSVDELRVFLGGGRRIIDPAKLEAMVKLLSEYRLK
ncbi:MAG: RNA polymerase Rpb4 family protein [Candidatus Bathyarchaeia archaeon]